MGPVVVIANDQTVKKHSCDSNQDMDEVMEKKSQSNVVLKSQLIEVTAYNVGYQSRKNNKTSSPDMF